MKSRYLIDPELVPASGTFPSFDLHTDTLPALRNQMQKSAIAALPPDNPAVAVETIQIPGSKGSPDIRVVAYRPSSAEGPLPVLLHFHGGGYVVGSPERKGTAHRTQAVELDCAIYSVDYRLALRPRFLAPLRMAMQCCDGSPITPPNLGLIVAGLQSLVRAQVVAWRQVWHCWFETGESCHSRFKASPLRCLTTERN
jgi:alpha/beta hydrolase fold